MFTLKILCQSLHIIADLILDEETIEVNDNIDDEIGVINGKYIYLNCVLNCD